MHPGLYYSSLESTRPPTSASDPGTKTLPRPLEKSSELRRGSSVAVLEQVRQREQLGREHVRPVVVDRGACRARLTLHSGRYRRFRSPVRGDVHGGVRPLAPPRCRPARPRRVPQPERRHRRGPREAETEPDLKSSCFPDLFLDPVPRGFFCPCRRRRRALTSREESTSCRASRFVPLRVGLRCGTHDAGHSGAPRTTASRQRIRGGEGRAEAEEVDQSPRGRCSSKNA